MANAEFYPGIRPGSKFGFITVIKEAPRRGKHKRALCRCECGVEREVLAFSLTGGGTTSCGCRRKEATRAAAQKMGRANRRHGRTGTPEYRAWRAAKGRCLDPGHPAYPRYGGRGIGMSPEWVDDFEAFYRDLGARPAPGFTLERVDNSKGYVPGNCEWRTWRHQNRNRRNTVMVEWRGKSVPLAKLAGRTGCNYQTLHRRIFTFGWDVERALTTPSRVRGNP